MGLFSKTSKIAPVTEASAPDTKMGTFNPTGSGLLSKFFSQLQNSGVDLTGATGPTAAQIEQLRNMGVTVTPPAPGPSGMKKGGSVKSGMKAGGAVKSSASKRADGCAMRGKTRGRMV